MKKIFLVLAMFLAPPAFAHDAMLTAAKPLGWAYPFACCSGFDCREAGRGHPVGVSESPVGYVISTTHEVISYSDGRLKDSPDGEFHWCSVAGKDDGRTVCLFVPPRGF